LFSFVLINLLPQSNNLSLQLPLLMKGSLIALNGYHIFIGGLLLDPGSFEEIELSTQLRQHSLSLSVFLLAFGGPAEEGSNNTLIFAQ
jgi:hypothetical protein